MSLTAGQTLSFYEILGPLGSGGMGEVYRARDTRLDRQVAIKVLSEELADDEERLIRFEREAKTLASLSHPNVAGIHGIDQVDETCFIAMELVPGEDLSQRLERGALSLDEALDVCRQVAEGLEAAHEAGVVHRDLKPANVRVTPQGLVKVLDFGLAKPMPREGSKDGSSNAPHSSLLTEEGRLLGTPTYMSPEQARGQAVDKRTDIWAFGCVLFECLTGKRAFHGETATDLLAAIIREEPDWDALPDATPEIVRDLLRRMLLKDARTRLRDIGEARVALTPEVAASTARAGRRWWQAAIGAACLVLLLVWAAERWDWWSGSDAETDPRSIAVLPFVNMSPNKENDYFSDGLTEQLTTALSQIKGLNVKGRTSAFVFKEKPQDLGEIGRRLGVANILEGSVRRAGTRVRITAQLIDLRTDEHLWANSYDRDLTDIFAIQSDVAQQVADAMRVALLAGEKEQLAKRPTESMEAYELYLLGRFHFAKATQAGWSDAIKAFNQAIQLDSGFALAHCGLADACAFAVGSFMSGKEALAQSAAAAQKAVALDPDLADAHLSLALCLAGDYDWPGAERELKRAIELNPNLALARDQYAWVLTMVGRFDEAITQSRMAVKLDSLSPMINVNLAWWLYCARRFDEAIVQFRKTLALDPNFAWAHMSLGWTLHWQQDAAGSLAAMKQGLSLDPHPWNAGSLGYLHAVAGDHEQAEQTLRDLELLAAQRYVTPAARMVVYLGLDDKEQALDWLEKCLADRDLQCWFLGVDPVYDRLRDEPRFKAVLKKVGLDN